MTYACKMCDDRTSCGGAEWSEEHECYICTHPHGFISPDFPTRCGFAEITEITEIAKDDNGNDRKDD